MIGNLNYFAAALFFSVFTSSIASASSNVEGKLCYIEIEAAYENAFLTNIFELQNSEICGQYKNSYDDNFRLSNLPKIQGEEQFDDMFSPIPTPLMEKSYKARAACLLHIKTDVEIPFDQLTHPDCVEFVRLAAQINKLTPPSLVN